MRNTTPISFQQLKITIEREVQKDDVRFVLFVVGVGVMLKYYCSGCNV